MSKESNRTEDSVKLCCADFYQQAAVKFFLGDSFHPGGLALTRMLAEKLGLLKGRFALDVACGEGTTAFFLAENFGCKVAGIDASEKAVKAAIEKLREHGTITFLAADAEHLPFPDRTFDAVLTECTFSTFSRKENCASEIFRVLKPDGLWGMSDMLVEQSLLPEKMKGLLFQAACIGEALSLKGYENKMMEAGFREIQNEEVSWALESWMEQVEKKLAGVQLLASLSTLPVTKDDLETAREFLEQGKELVRKKIIGYGIVIGKKPS